MYLWNTISYTIPSEPNNNQFTTVGTVEKKGRALVIIINTIIKNNRSIVLYWILLKKEGGTRFFMFS
jgi:hypothetical protein